MIAERTINQETELMSYTIASNDMRFIGIGERVLYICPDLRFGLVVRGEMPGCGPENYANLSQIILEYVMSCADDHQSEVAAKKANDFGQQLAQKITKICFNAPVTEPNPEDLIHVLKIIFNSMDVPYVCTQDPHKISVRLAYCPLHKAANQAALNLWLPLAHRTFLSLINTLTQTLSPNWKLLSPEKLESNCPIQEIIFVEF